MARVVDFDVMGGLKKPIIQPPPKDIPLVAEPNNFSALSRAVRITNLKDTGVPSVWRMFIGCIHLHDKRHYDVFGEPPRSPPEPKTNPFQVITATWRNRIWTWAGCYQ